MDGRRRRGHKFGTHLEQVVHTPGKDDDVVDVEQGHDHDGGVTDACREMGGGGAEV